LIHFWRERPRIWRDLCQNCDLRTPSFAAAASILAIKRQTDWPYLRQSESVIL
jgi:hypothetical protein